MGKLILGLQNIYVWRVFHSIIHEGIRCIHLRLPGPHPLTSQDGAAFFALTGAGLAAAF
jgi:hypothetical protein